MYQAVSIVINNKQLTLAQLWILAAVYLNFLFHIPTKNDAGGRHKTNTMKLTWHMILKCVGAQHIPVWEVDWTLKHCCICIHWTGLLEWTRTFHREVNCRIACALLVQLRKHYADAETIKLCPASSTKCVGQQELKVLSLPCLSQLLVHRSWLQFPLNLCCQRQTAHQT